MITLLRGVLVKALMGGSASIFVVALLVGLWVRTSEANTCSICNQAAPNNCKGTPANCTGGCNALGGYWCGGCGCKADVTKTFCDCL